MGLRGLFIGIDRCASLRVGWLACAERDARALHALFADTFGGESTLLTGAAATRDAISRGFEQLGRADPDDVVVVSFSGHGARTSHIVAFDSDPVDLDNTAILLETLAKWFVRIPAKRLVCILDCCFSGGMGAKVLEVEAVPRGIDSTEALLERLSGEGRIILTASKSDEEAWESAKLGHGVLTYYLLQALRGVEEVKREGKIPIYRLFEYVTTKVIDHATTLGKSQHPTVRGRIDGDFTWPALIPGAVYRAAFPEHAHKRVTSALESLASYGFPANLLQAWAQSIPSLNALQIAAINEFNLLEGQHLVVSAPTSSGKTMVGELAALRAALERKRSLFLLPLKALVNDKHRHFNRVYGTFGLRTIRATGDSTSDEIQPLMRGQYDVCLMTYEKCAGLLLGSPHILDQVAVIVVDEVQMIADASRGVNLEFLLTLLRVRRRQAAEPQLIALSAVIGDTNGLERWLDAGILRRTERPVPLDEGVIRGDGSFRYIASDLGGERIDPAHVRPELRKGSSQDYIIPLVRKLAAEGKSTLVFRETRGEAQGCALYLAQALGLPPAQEALDGLPIADPSSTSARLRQALEGGVAFHTSYLDPDERQVIEDQFRRRPSSIRAIAATTTLAMGVNTPAEAVIVAGLKHPDDSPYSVAEYKNMVGRAGRLGLAERGVSYLLATSPNDEHYYWTRYVCGKPEDLLSRFLSDTTDPRSLIIRVLVTAQGTGQGMTADEIVSFLEGSFGAFQAKGTRPQWQWDGAALQQALESLRAHQLVVADPGGLYRLAELGSMAGEAGVEVESIVRLVDALRLVTPQGISDPTLIALTQLTVELDAVLFPINKKSTQKEPQAWFGEIQRQGVPAPVLNALQRLITERGQAVLRAKKAVACLLWVTERPIVEIEKVLTQFGGASDGAAGAIRGVAARTCDLLPTVARVAELLHPGLDLGERVSRLLVRLEIGLPAAAIDLASTAGNRLARGDYQLLVRAGLSSIGEIDRRTDDEILRVLGANKAKVQVVREAAAQHRKAENERKPTGPMLEPYQG